MRANPVCWFEIYVDDMPRAQAFYQQVLQVTLQPLPVDGIQMLAFDMDEKVVGAGGSFDDCANEESRVVAAGGQVLRPKMSIGPYGFVSLALDTEGNTIGLHSMQ